MHIHQDRIEGVDSALHQAQQICERSGARLTRLRKQILTLILRSHQPLGAYQLMDLLREHSHREQVAPPTVYRSLDFLLQQGLIHKVHSLNAYLGCNRPNRCQIAALFICSHCHHTEEAANNAMEQAINLSAAQHRFAVTQPIIEVQGLCSSCKKNAGNQEARS